jgi:hypothetical protein
MTVGVTLMGLAGSEIVGAWGWIGVIPMVTGMTGNCPANGLFGINSAKK